jgi:hypothetical protein
MNIPFQLSREQCQAEIKHFSGANYHKFTNIAQAEAYVNAPEPSTAGSPRKAQVSFPSSDTRSSKRPRLMNDEGEGAAEDEDKSSQDVVYCDGACKGNGKSGSVAGIGVYWGPRDPR